MKLWPSVYLSIVSVNPKSKIRNSKWARVLLACVLWPSVNASAADEAKSKNEWSGLVEAARKEGQVTVYISGYEAVLPFFEKEFPDIKLTAVTARGNQLGQRLLSERRAEKYLADVVSSGANPNYQVFYPAKALTSIKGALILPEVRDQTKWYLNKHQYSDPESQYVFNYVGSATYGAVNYNSKLVDIKDFKSYWDLLNPKWKGKSKLVISGKPGPVQVILDSSIITQKSARRLSASSSVKWIRRCFAIFVRGRIGWQRESSPSVFSAMWMS